VALIVVGVVEVPWLHLLARVVVEVFVVMTNSVVLLVVVVTTFVRFALARMIWPRLKVMTGLLSPTRISSHVRIVEAWLIERVLRIRVLHLA
jgi:hypothetical protein